MDTTQQPAIEAGSVPGSAEPLSPEATAERLRELAVWGVDLSLIQASLERTPTERIERLEAALELLREHQIALLADVRTAPYSRHWPQFNREDLARSLQAAGETGQWSLARPRETQWRSANARLCGDDERGT